MTRSPGLEDPDMSRDPPPPWARAPERERFHSFLEGVKDYAIFMTDPEGCVLSWNVGAERILGYPAAEVIGRGVSLFCTPEQVRGGTPVAELRRAARDCYCEQERWYVRKDGTRFWAHALLSCKRRGAFDVILLDIGLPQMDGFEAARRLRAEQGARPPILVAVTGYGYPADRERSREAGFDRHVKPLDPARLDELLAALTAERRNPAR
jgi:PAS domain S-box-containing protein